MVRIFVFALIFLVAGCGQRVTAFTIYANSSKYPDKLRADVSSCEAAAGRGGRSTGRNITSEAVAGVDPALWVLSLPFTAIDYGDDDFGKDKWECLASQGWEPLYQFVGVSAAGGDEGFRKAVERCGPELKNFNLLERLTRDEKFVNGLISDDPNVDVEDKEDVDRFASCLKDKGWSMVTRPPWYFDGQKVTEIEPRIPKGNWELLFSLKEAELYYDSKLATWLRPDVIRVKLLRIQKDGSRHQFSTRLFEADCASRKYRESLTRRIEAGAWVDIGQGTDEQGVYAAFCLKK